MQEVMPNIFAFQVDLPKSPLKAINSYLIKGHDRNVLFDTAYNLPECQIDLLNGLNQLGLQVQDIDLVLTHLHADHTGLVNLFSDAGCKIYASKTDGDYANSMATGEYWDLMNSFLELYGMRNDEIHITDNPGYLNKLDHPFEYEVLIPGDLFNVGDYHFKVYDLMGHTPGHIGLYDSEKKIMFSGDTVLDPMTPNITYWGSKYTSILGSYIQTLENLKKLDLEKMFATHRKIITNPIERINEIIFHHYDRMQEILDAMEYNKIYTVRDLSAKISWQIKADSWDDFPKSQKWFAVGETMAHMEYLANLSYLTMENKAGNLQFTKLKGKIVSS